MLQPEIAKIDPWLEPYQQKIAARYHKYCDKINWICDKFGSIIEFASAYKFYGLHKTHKGWIFRENAPNATAIYLIGSFNNWKKTNNYRLKNIGFNNWEISLPEEALKHLDQYKLRIEWEGGAGERLPAYVDYVVQDEETKIFAAQVWSPAKSYQWKHKAPKVTDRVPYIYESHVGMGTEEEWVGTWREFAENVLPHIKQAGYSAVQLMAVQEHPYYGSFGYHVSNYFAPSSRFGTPDDLKYLIDSAHKLNLAVIMDIVHSHAVKNENEGLALFDGTPYHYFHDGYRRKHVAWDSLCFDYNKTEPLRLLLSNCRYWLEEFKFDGFRFDGVTSMLYLDHGLERSFTSYEQYFNNEQDEDAIMYLMLANHVITETNPNTITIAEDMSGMPGLAAPIEQGGFGFNFRLAMGTPDYWIKLIKKLPDEQWTVGEIYHELTNKRPEEQTISYVESHDQALVGDQTIIFRLIGKEMYWHMNKESESMQIDRGIALHKIIRLITIATSGGGYLNFMGNEFGHPEWIDFPREGNNWSFQYARRQWTLAANKNLRYHFLADFDKAMLELVHKEKILHQPNCKHIYEHNTDQVLVFSRKNLLFVFNFNPTQSFVDYGFEAPQGEYTLVLNTDSKVFGGFNLVDEKVTYYTQSFTENEVNSAHFLQLYIPSRSAMVFKTV